MTGAGIPGREEAARRNARLWCLAFFLAMTLLVVAGLRDWWRESHVREILHVTAVDPDGRILWTKEAGDYRVEEIWIENTIQRWIEWVRWRGDDTVIDSRDRNRAEAMTDRQCAKDVKQYFTSRTTQGSQAGNRMRVELTDFVREKQGPRVYKFWWTERWRPTYGQPLPDMKMSGTFTVEVRTSKGVLGPVLKTGDIQRSGLGIFLTDCWMSTLQSTKGS